MLICVTPQSRVGALPAYKAGLDLPAMSPLVLARSLSVTLVPGARFAAIGRFKPPEAHVGLVGPKPVPQMVTTEPGLAGFNRPLSVPSSFKAAACDETPGCNRKMPGTPKTTGTVTGPTGAPL